MKTLIEKYAYEIYETTGYPDKYADILKSFAKDLVFEITPIRDEQKYSFQADYCDGFDTAIEQINKNLDNILK